MKRVFLLGATLVGFALVACGSDESKFGDSDPNKPIDDGSRGGTLAPGQTGPGGVLGQACVSKVASATLSPTNLIFMYDKSGSMGTDPPIGPMYTKALRWNPVNAGMTAFFGDAYTKTLNASLQ